MIENKGQNTNNQRRSSICTIAALSSGILGLSVGGLMSTSGQLQACQTHPWGLEQLCSTWAAPGAFFRGGFAGLWVGTILGAFAAGVATHQPVSELNDADDGNDEEIPWSEIQAWIEAASRLDPQHTRTLSAEQTQALLKQLGFSQGAIDRARVTKREERAIEPIDSSYN